MSSDLQSNRGCMDTKMPSWKRFKRILRKSSSKRSTKEKRNVLKTNIDVFNASEDVLKRLCDRELLADRFDVNFTTTSVNQVTCRHQVTLNDFNSRIRQEQPSRYENAIRTSEFILLACSLNNIRSFDQVLKIVAFVRRVDRHKPVIVLVDAVDDASLSEEQVKIRFGFYRYVSSHDCALVELGMKTNSAECWKTILEEVQNRRSVGSGEIQTIEQIDDTFDGF